jgi:hypothetical protein
MNQTIEEKNKELVLKAFDTLFNKRDYAAAERRCFGSRSKTERMIPSMILSGNPYDNVAKVRVRPASS